MLYLVTGKAEEINGPLIASENYFSKLIPMIEGMINPSFEIFNEWERQGKAKGGLYSGERGGVAVIEANSNEELAAMLSSLPMWGIINWEVKPLHSWRAGIDINNKNLNNFRNMGKK